MLPFADSIAIVDQIHRAESRGGVGANSEVSWHYGRAYRHLKDNRSLSGANDLWIAATAWRTACRW